MRNSFLHTLLLLTLGCNCTAQATAPPSSEPLVPRSQTTLEHVSFTTEDGAIIYADLYGAGERGVVLAHGGQFNKGSWRAQAEQLASAGFRVLAFDFRGFGQSHGPGDSDMYSALCDWTFLLQSITSERKGQGVWQSWVRVLEEAQLWMLVSVPLSGRFSA